ncbi:hypothetical protein [Paraburkholderia sp. BL21I4N1]|uniref:hypothetical protein n=1 Tax=Paraburkholderia sp. BL21I4N1 TaxID=1938801 RepID=UPI0011B1F8BF|nr:hypothetical protein [Paraburkholderia sp. BL21I4N1]
MDSDYSVLLNADQNNAPGGTITYPITGTPLPTGYQLVVLGDLPIDQETDITNSGGFYPEVIEDMVDRATIQIQQVAEVASRAIVYTEAESTSPVLPPAAVRANTVLGFDASGNVELMSLPASVGAGDLKNESWTDGVDYTSGTSTSVTLSRAYGNKANLGQVVMQGVSQDPNSYSLNNLTLTFTDGNGNPVVIPAGTPRIWCIGGTSLSVFTPPDGSVTDAKVAAGSALSSARNRVSDFVSLSDFGCLYDGSDETAKVLAAVAAIGASARTLVVPQAVRISANVTFGFSTELHFEQGGMIVGTAGTEVVQIQKSIMAGPRQIFSNCKPIATVAMVVAPEWYGAKRVGVANDDLPAFKLALAFLANTGGMVYGQPGDYGWNGTLTGFPSKVILKGCGETITRFLTFGTTSNGIQAYGVPGALLSNIGFKEFSLRSSAPATTNTFGLDIQYTSFTLVENVEVADFLYGFKQYQSPNMYLRRTLSTYQGQVAGCISYVIDGGGGAPGNESSVYDHAWYQGNGNLGTNSQYAAGSIGFRFTGTYMSDMEFINPQGTQTQFGMVGDASAAGAFCEDITIINPVFDQWTTQGLSLNGFGQYGGVSVIGGWINPKAGTGAETDCVLITNCRGVMLTGALQLVGTGNVLNAVGVNVSNSQNIIVEKSVRFRDMHYGIKGNGTALCQFKGNFYNQSSAAQAFIYLTGDARSLVGGVCDGYATNAIVVDATSSGTLDDDWQISTAGNIGAPHVSNSAVGAVHGVCTTGV